MPRFRTGIFARLLRIALLSSIPLLLFAGLLIDRHVSAHRDSLQARVEETARALSSLVKEKLEKDQGLLTGLAHSPSLETGDLRSFYRQAAAVVPGPERWVVLFNRTRDQLLNTRVPYGAKLPRNVIAPRVEEAFETGNSVLGDLRSGSIAGDMSFGIVVPAVIKGKVMYALALTSYASSLSKELERYQVPEGWTVAVLDRHGRIVARNRASQEWVGKRAVPELLAIVAEQREGAARIPTLEGDPTYAHVVRIGDSGWSVVVGASEYILEAPLTRSLLWFSASGGIFLLMALGLAAWSAQGISRPMARLAHMAGAVGHREKPLALPRTGIAEIDRVQEAMTSAADKLHETRTHQERVEEELRNSERRYRALFEQAAVGVTHTTLEGRWLLVNHKLCEILGYSQDELIGRNFLDFTHPDDLPSDREYLKALDSGAVDSITREKRYIRKDGTAVWVSVSVANVRYSAQAPTYRVAVIQDVTERKQSEQKLEFLLKELSHRVKNSLAVVQAIANQTFKSTDTAEAFITAFRGRLSALGHAHQLLSKADWSGASLREIVELELLGFVPADSTRIAVVGDDVMLSPEVAPTVAMVLHELATNAVKYGSLSVPEGRIELEWRPSPSHRSFIDMNWLERNGPRPEPSKKRGFGLAFVERVFEYQIESDVRLHFETTGFRCEMRIPFIGHPQRAPGQKPA